MNQFGNVLVTMDQPQAPSSSFQTSNQYKQQTAAQSLVPSDASAQIAAPGAKEVMHSLPQLSVSNWIAALSGQSLRNLSVYQHHVAPKVTEFWQSVAAKQSTQSESSARSASGAGAASEASAGSADVLATFTCPVQGNLTILPTFSLGSVHTAVSDR